MLGKMLNAISNVETRYSHLHTFIRHASFKHY